MRPEMQKLTDDEMKQRLLNLRNRLRTGETLDDLLPEAFALVREATKKNTWNRTLSMSDYRRYYSYIRDVSQK
ncbi:MAG: hypothetical protein ACLUR5_00830 [Eubacterium ventriosum]